MPGWLQDCLTPLVVSCKAFKVKDVSGRRPRALPPEEEQKRGSPFKKPRVTTGEVRWLHAHSAPPVDNEVHVNEHRKELVSC